MTEVRTNDQTNTGQTIIYAQQDKKSNGAGTAGFVLALLAILLCWIPVVNWILWVLGLIFSLIGVFKEPRGMAIAGLVLSLLGIIIMMVVLGGLMAAMSTM